VSSFVFTDYITRMSALRLLDVQTVKGFARIDDQAVLTGRIDINKFNDVKPVAATAVAVPTPIAVTTAPATSIVPTPLPALTLTPESL